MPKNIYHRIIESTEPFVIAEVGANHNGDINLAKKLIITAKKCGADAVKFQSWTKKSLFVKSFYKEKSQFVDKKFGTLEDMVERFSLNKAEHIELKKYCDKQNIIFCSTPFSIEEADLLEELGVLLFKIASMDINHVSFLKHVAKKGKTIILSTGMAALSEIENALDTIYDTGNQKVILLHCVSIYPPDDKIINLRNIIMLKETFGVPVGFSDHSIGISIPLAAVAIGAKVIEKHFTLDKNLPGWDHAVSADPEELEIIVKESKRITKALGYYQRNFSETELEQRKVFRRSIVTKRKIKKGETIKESDIDFKRPGNGIRPDQAKYIIGRKAKKDIENDTLIKWSDLI